MSRIEEINKEISLEISKPEVERALVATTFKGLSTIAMKKAIMEGMMRGFTFKDFLEKNIYAIPFKDNYSLITSIDYARKIGMRSGIVGISSPVFTIENNIITCTITVKRKVGEYIGDYSASVDMNEYSTGRNQWLTKPKTMLAKVAEMHALRKACPEELSQAYSEEEMVKEIEVKDNAIDIVEYQVQLEGVGSSEELKKVWSSLPIQVKEQLKDLKDSLKAKYEKA